VIQRRDSAGFFPLHVLYFYSIQYKTSALKNIGTGLEITIKDLTEGKFKGGEATIYDLSSGGVGYEITEHLPSDIVEYVNKKLEGRIDVK